MDKWKQDPWYHVHITLQPFKKTCTKLLIRKISVYFSPFSSRDLLKKIRKVYVRGGQRGCRVLSTNLYKVRQMNECSQKKLSGKPNSRMCAESTATKGMTWYPWQKYGLRSEAKICDQLKICPRNTESPPPIILYRQLRFNFVHS